MAINKKRRQLAKALLASPLYSLVPSAYAVSQGDIDAANADLYWQHYLKNGEKAPRHENRQCEQALQEIAAPIMATSTRKHLDWRIGLLRADPPNAFTPGGGVVFVMDSLIALCDSEAELASVIAHEVGHIEHRHAIRRIYAENVLAELGIDVSWDTKHVVKAFRQREYELVSHKLVYKSYKRLWEHQADAHIIRAFTRLGYPMKDSYGFFEKLTQIYGDSDPGLCIFNTHPMNKERVKRLKGLSRAYRRNATKGDSEAFRYLKSELI